MERFDELVMHEVVRWLPLADRGSFRLTSKTCDEKARKRFLFSRVLKFHERRIISRPQMRILMRKFDFRRSLRLLLVRMSDVELPFVNQPATIPLGDLREMLDDLHELRLIFRIDVNRGTNQLAELPEWHACDRWRFGLETLSEQLPGPRWTQIFWVPFEADEVPPSQEWLFLCNLRFAPTFPLMAGNYRILIFLAVNATMIDPLVDWLQTSSCPSLRMLCISGDGPLDGQPRRVVTTEVDYWVPEKIEVWGDLVSDEIIECLLHAIRREL